jgi:hypothetical protein
MVNAERKRSTLFSGIREGAVGASPGREQRKVASERIG